jgi:hypothetical protein
MPQWAAGVKRRFQAGAAMLDLTSCSRTPYTAGASCRGNSKGENYWHAGELWGASGQAQLSATALRPKSLRWAWFGVCNASGQPDVQARGVANRVLLIVSGAVDPYISGVYPREQAPEAHRLLAGRLSQGKLALVHPN